MRALIAAALVEGLVGAVLLLTDLCGRGRGSKPDPPDSVKPGATAGLHIGAMIIASRAVVAETQ